MATRPGLACLNHSGFGATLVPVLADQQAWQAALERNPTVFLARRLPNLLADVRATAEGPVPGHLQACRNA